MALVTIRSIASREVAKYPSLMPSALRFTLDQGPHSGASVGPRGSLRQGPLRGGYRSPPWLARPRQRTRSVAGPPVDQGRPRANHCHCEYDRQL